MTNEVSYLPKLNYKVVETFDSETAIIGVIYCESSTGKLYTYNGVKWTAIQDEFIEEIQTLTEELNTLNDIILFY